MLRLSGIPSLRFLVGIMQYNWAETDLLPIADESSFPAGNLATEIDLAVCVYWNSRGT